MTSLPEKVQTVILAIRSEGGECTEAQAKAAILAMRHPTPEMLTAAVNAERPNYRLTVGDIISIEFNAAINAAVK